MYKWSVESQKGVIKYKSLFNKFLLRTRRMLLLCSVHTCSLGMVIIITTTVLIKCITLPLRLYRCAIAPFWFSTLTSSCRAHYDLRFKSRSRMHSGFTENQVCMEWRLDSLCMSALFVFGLIAEFRGQEDPSWQTLISDWLQEHNSLGVTHLKTTLSKSPTTRNWFYLQIV